jgi:hypothetical protein
MYGEPSFHGKMTSYVYLIMSYKSGIRLTMYVDLDIIIIIIIGKSALFEP